MKDEERLEMRKRSQELRKNPTPEEKKLWDNFLKNYVPQINRQKVIGYYIADFYCKKAKLVIELDGNQHYKRDALEYDGIRSGYLSRLGIEVMRISNIDVNTK